MDEGTGFDFTAIRTILGEPRCAVCRKTASELIDSDVLNDYYGEPGHSPAEYCKEDGTYNPRSNQFVCTPCYIKIGSPTSPRGWKAP